MYLCVCVRVCVCVCVRVYVCEVCEVCEVCVFGGGGEVEDPNNNIIHAINPFSV